MRHALSVFARGVSLVLDCIDHPPIWTAPDLPRYLSQNSCLSVRGATQRRIFFASSPSTELLSSALISIPAERNRSWLAGLVDERGLVMPHYFFHLSFGDRVLPDEEGVELSSRAAARREALAVVRELSGSVANRWAGWFLRVVDQEGQFLSLPMGHPALELVSDGVPQRGSTAGDGKHGEGPSGRGQAGSLHERAAAVFEQASTVRERTASLLERNQQLRSELSSKLRLNRAVRDRVRQLVSHARSVLRQAGARLVSQPPAPRQGRCR
jgi:hypothetical protein